MKNNDNINRHEILKIFRKYRQLTQQQVADMAKINYRQYQKFESGERDIMNATFELVCRVLDVLDISINKFYKGGYAYLLNENIKNDMNKIKEAILKEEFVVTATYIIPTKRKKKAK